MVYRPALLWRLFSKVLAGATDALKVFSEALFSARHRLSALLQPARFFQVQPFKFFGFFLVVTVFGCYEWPLLTTL
jgi:hypothetical protein